MLNFSENKLKLWLRGGRVSLVEVGADLKARRGATSTVDAAGRLRRETGLT